MKGRTAVEKNQAAAGTQTALADLIVPAGDADFDLFGGERGFYLLASLALGDILKKAPLRKAAATERRTERPSKHSSPH